MAKPTSSRNRSKRRASRRPTSSASRASRSRSSSNSDRITRSGQGGRGARVTNASRRTNTGSARVTTSTRSSLPPGNKGGNLAKTKSGALTTRGGSVQRSGNNVLKVKVRDLGTTQRGVSGSRSAGAIRSAGGALVKSPGGALAKTGTAGLRQLAGRVAGAVGMGMEKVKGSQQRGEMRAAGKHGRAALHGLADSMLPGGAIPSAYEAAKKLKDAVRSSVRRGAGGGQGNRGRNQTTTTSSGPKRPEGATGGRGGSTYKPRPVRGPLADKRVTTPAPQAPKAPPKPKADHGKHTETINKLLKQYKELQKNKKFKMADSLGKAIHAMKYKKENGVLKVRR